MIQDRLRPNPRADRADQGRDGHQKASAIGHGAHILDTQVLDERITTLGENFVERHGDLAAKLTNLAVVRASVPMMSRADRLGRGGDSVTSAVGSTANAFGDSLRIHTILVTEFSTERAQRRFGRKMIRHD